ncbi:nucleoside-diphosphate-sugar epimerase [Staphylococcus sp. AntiMn-1]|nr:nucleoside-diphosphate-sugar epimerase [Staphylococcus sp. AntiMn-1]OIS55485.1 hypothetical protein A4A29_13745 [Staphylococcus equorum]
MLKHQGFNKVKHIIFMSDLIPNTNELPPCLRSRIECKDILGAYGVPVTTLRAGLIISAKGSSYPILKNWYPMLVFI